MGLLERDPFETYTPSRFGEARIAPPSSGTNAVIAALPDDERRRLTANLDVVAVRPFDVLAEPQQERAYAYFPLTAALSIVGVLRTGDSAEVARVGSAGVAGVGLFLGRPVGQTRIVAQRAGTVGRIPAEMFRRLSVAPSALHEALLQYTAVRLGNLAQIATCNASHDGSERCARWLMAASDGPADEPIFVTHEFLALMLNLRRASVTMTMRAFFDAGLIRYRRGNVQIVDRARLANASCECFGVMTVA